MILLLSGGILLGSGAILALWLGFNLLVARQPEFQFNFVSVLFMAGLLFVGAKWTNQGWRDVAGGARKKKRRKKKRTEV